MQQRFPKKLYGQRWQIETVFSMLKRNLGPSLRARRYHSQTREIRARILTHNLAILLWMAMFYTEQDGYYLLSPGFVRFS
jgi:transposase